MCPPIAFSILRLVQNDGREAGERRKGGRRRTYELSHTRWHSCFLMEWMVGIVSLVLQIAFFNSSSATLQIVQALAGMRGAHPYPCLFPYKSVRRHTYRSHAHPHETGDKL